MPTPDPIPATVPEPVPDPVPDPVAGPDRWSGFDTPAHHTAQDACHHLIHCAVTRPPDGASSRHSTAPAPSVTSPRCRCCWPS